MKKFLSTLAIFAMAATVFTGCKKDDPKPTPSAIKLTMPDKLTVKPGETAELEIKASAKATEAITIALVSSDMTKATVTATITIKAGEQSAKAEVTGVADGTTEISATAMGATAPANKCAVTVSAEGVKAEIGQIDLDFTNSTAEYVPFMYEGGQVGCIFYTTSTWESTEGGAGRWTIDNYGSDIVGTSDADGLNFSAIAEGTVINSEMAWQENEGYDDQSTWYQMPNLTKLSGEVFIVGKFGDYPFWAKLNMTEITANNFDNIEVFVCLNADEAEFKVGQKE